MLHNRLVCGLRNQTIQRKLLIEADPTLKKAYNVVHGMEMAFQQASELQVSTHADSKPTHEIDKIEHSRGADNPRPGGSCYHCGQSGHVPDCCYYKGQVCWKCHKQGHIAKMFKGKPAQSEAQVSSEKVEYVETEDDSTNSND